MKFTSKRVLSLLLAIGFGLAAQRAAAAQKLSDLGISQPLTAHAGFTESNGTLRGEGPGYIARFEQDRIAFLPVLGRAAPYTAELALSAPALGRESGPTVPLGGGQTRRVGARTEVAYASGVVARYEARQPGLEQSFVLSEAPAGAGDLVLEQRVATTWPLASVDPASGVRWEASGVGGVRIGGVTAIDADGRSRAGTVVFSAGVLQYRVPADFVSSARFPLVVDPLVSTIFPIADHPVVNETGAVVRQYGPDRYYVLYRLWPSSQSSNIYLRYVIPSTGFVSGSKTIKESIVGALSQDLAMAVNPGGIALVAFPREYSPGSSTYRAIESAFVWPDGDVQQPSTILYDPAGHDLGHPVVVPSSIHSGTGFQLIYTHDFDVPNWVEARGVGGIWSPVFASPKTLHIYDWQTEAIDALAISPQHGTNPNYLLVMTRRSFATGDRNLIARVIDDQANVLSAATTIAGTTTSDEDDASVAGNGDEFLIAWRELAHGSTDSGIYARRLRYSSFSGTSLEAPFEVKDLNGFAESGPAVGTTSDGYVVAWKEPGLFSTDDIYAAQLNKTTLTTCGPVDIVSSATHDLSHPAISTQWTPSDTVLLAFEGTSTSSGLSNLYGQSMQTVMGQQTSLGGGCGFFSGVATAGCSFTASSTLPISLRNALAGAPALLILSLNHLDYASGGCTLYPNPFQGFLIGTGNTTVNGSKDYFVPLTPTPTLAGLNFYAQWGTYVGASGAFQFLGTPTGLNLSTAVKGTFE